MYGEEKMFRKFRKMCHVSLAMEMNVEHVGCEFVWGAQKMDKIGRKKALVNQNLRTKQMNFR